MPPVAPLFRTCSFVCWTLLAAPGLSAAEEFDESIFDAPTEPADAAQTFDESVFDAPTQPGAQEFDESIFGQPELDDETTSPEPSSFEGPQLRLFRGSLRASCARDTVDENDREDRWEAIGQARLSAQVSLGDSLMAAVGGRFIRYFADGERSDHLTESRLWEAWVGWSGGDWELTVGQQVVNWGRAELINPTGHLNPQDFRFFVDPDPDALTLPIPMVRADYYWGDWRAQAVWIPFYRETETFVSFRDWSLLPPGAEAYSLMGQFTQNQTEKFHALLDRADRPADDLSASEFGLRLDGSAGGYDFSVSYFAGWNDLPQIDAEAIFGVSGEALPPELPEALLDALLDEALASNAEAYRFDRFQSAGFDFGAPVGDFLLLFEGAWYDRKPVYRQDLSTDDEQAFFGVVGLEYIYGERWAVNLQYFHYAIPDLSPGPTVLYERHLHGATFYVRTERLDGRLTAELRGAVLFNQQALVLQPRLAWKFFDQWEGVSAAVGANIVEAPNDELLSAYDPNDQIFLSVSVEF